MKNSTALLLIDIQNDYFHGGRMELVGAGKAALKAATVLQYFRENRLPVIHIAHEAAREGATFFLPGTEGQRINDLVVPLEGEVVVTKNFPNSFLKTPLLDILRQLEISRVVIVGMMTHMCVDSTARGAKDLGLACTLVDDATATRDLSFRGEHVEAGQVQAAFIAALASICDEVLGASELIRSFSHTTG